MGESPREGWKSEWERWLQETDKSVEQGGVPAREREGMHSADGLMMVPTQP